MSDSDKPQGSVPQGPGMINGVPVKEAWELRRRVIYTILIFSALLFIWGMNIEEPTKLQEMIIDGVLTLDIFIILGWLLGSSLEDSAANIANKKYGG